VPEHCSRFEGVTFTGTALFKDATFTGYTLFKDATFTGTTHFGGATFSARDFDNVRVTHLRTPEGAQMPHVWPPGCGVRLVPDGGGILEETQGHAAL
jgi:hypothetical protein